MPPFPPQTWKAEIGYRMRQHFMLKLVGVTVFTWLFFVGYFYVLRNPAYPVTVMPLTWVDRLVPFQPEALFVYVSLWLYVGVAPGLQRNFRELVAYGVWVSCLCIAGLTFFHFWPTQVPPLLFDVSGFAGFAMLQGIDASGNACPSMHVAVAIFTAIRLESVLREAGTPAALRLLNWAWFVAIAYSTLAIRQHVALDVLAGALLGTAFALPSVHWRPKSQRRAGPSFGADIIPATEGPRSGATTDIAQ